MTKVLLQVLIGVSVLFSVSLFAINAFAENANCARDCEAPTLGVLDDGQRVVEKGLTINSQSVTVQDDIQTIPTVAIGTGNMVNVRLMVYENNGAAALNHVSFAISDYQDDNNHSDKAIISIDQDFEGKQTVTVTDPNDLIKGATANITSLDQFNSSVDLSFKIMKPFATSSVIVNIWDEKASSRSNVFLDAIKAYGKPIVEETQTANTVLAPLKQVEAGIAPEKVECREGFELVIRSTTGMPACVYPFTAEILRTWGMVNAS